MNVDLKVAQTIRKSPLFQPGLEVIHALRKRDFEAYFAGGAVRDALLGRPIQDMDIATSARPEEVSALFSEVIKIGSAFGVVGVKQDRVVFEVTTFRSESDYADGRRPQHVVYADLQSDAARRDFTMNALYFDPMTERTIDLVGGIQDIHHKVIRTVGEPRLRFGEDHLRMLRALRFASTLGFRIEPLTLGAIHSLAPTIEKISKERITVEMTKLLSGSFADQGLTQSWKAGVLHSVCKRKWSDREFFHLIRRLFLVSPEIENRWACVLWDFYGDSPEAFSRGLSQFRFSNELQQRIQNQIRGATSLLNREEREGVRLRILGLPYGLWALDLACAVAQERGDTSALAELERIVRRYRALADERGALPLPLVTSELLISLKVPTGALFGQLLTETYLLQLEGRLTDQAQARQWVETQLT